LKKSNGSTLRVAYFDPKKLAPYGASSYFGAGD
jgi:hypothetical protein